MIEELLFSLTVIAAVGSSIVGGVFFAFSTFVMKALARLPDSQGIAAMQSINVTVINRWFMTLFLGTALVCVPLAATALPRWREPDAIILLVGSGFYIVGCLGVTILFNVPRNNRLASVKPESVKATTYWEKFVRTWTAWNTVRTVAALAATAAFTAALVTW